MDRLRLSDVDSPTTTMLQVAAAGTADSGREVESTTSAFVTWSVTRMSAMSTGLSVCALCLPICQLCLLQQPLATQTLCNVISVGN